MSNGAGNFLLAMQTASRKDSDMACKIKAKRILQLSAGGLSRRSIAKMKGFSEHGVIDTLDAAAERNVTYEDVASLNLLHVVQAKRLVLEAWRWCERRGSNGPHRPQRDMG